MSILWEIVQRTSGKRDRLMKGFLVTLPVLDSLCVVLFPCLAFSCMIFVIIVLKSTSILRLMSPLFGGLSVRWSKLCNNRSINLPIDTVHVYFDCMNSTLLLLTIQNELERVFVGRRIPPLRRAHLWLGVKPHQDLSQPVWDAVCLAYFKACDLMRRKAYAMALETGWTDTSAQEVSHTGMLSFWQALSTFVGVGGPGPEWVFTSPQISRQPFIQYDEADDRWSVTPRV